MIDVSFYIIILNIEIHIEGMFVLVIKVVELFAGVGGFRLGLEGIHNESNLEVVWSNQYEPSTKTQHAFECYETRFGNRGTHINEDIAEVDTNDIPNHDLLVGGFPCQDYSVARSLSGGLGIRGKKGVLFWEIIRIVKDKKPKFILLENVDRLLKSPSNQRGRDFGVMLASLHNLGYIVEWRVINAADYGFVQRRRRIFIFAYHQDTNYARQQSNSEMSDVIHSDGFFADKFPIQQESSTVHQPITKELSDDIVEVSNEFSALFRNSGVMRNGHIYSEEVIPCFVEPKTLGDILEKDVDEKFYLNHNQVMKNGMTLLEQFEYMKGPKKIERTSANGHSYIYSEGGMAFPDPLDRPSRTMLTSEATKNRSTHVVEDPTTKRLRLLTPIECERLNGFPDDWTNTPGMTERKRYFCMGNALVVGLIEIMGAKISELAKKEN